jgi:hypothetical protein
MVKTATKANLSFSFHSVAISYFFLSYISGYADSNLKDIRYQFAKVE